MVGDGLKQPAYEIFSGKCKPIAFGSPSPNSLLLTRPAHSGVKHEYPLKSGYFSLLACLP